MDVKNGTPISIELQTEVYQNNEKKEYFFDLSGQLIQMGDTLYLRYKEKLEDGAAEVPVTFKIEPDGSIHLIRAGEIRMRLKFDYQQRNESHYRTPYGMMPISTFTSNLRISLKDQPFSGSILVDYDLFSGQEKLGTYHIRLKFTS